MKRSRRPDVDVFETIILQKIRLAVGGIPGVRIFRNNTGRIEDKTGRWHVFGLCPGASDLIGWSTITISPEMVGRRIAVFAAIEVKRPGGRREPAQSLFIEAVRQAGGYADFAESVDDALATLQWKQ